MWRSILVFLLAASLEAAAPVSGVVVEDHSGAHLVSARVRIRAVSGEVVADRDSDSAGRFETPPLEPAVYRVEVSKPNYLGAWLVVEHPAKSAQVRLTKLGVISGRVTDQAQRPLARTFVFPLIPEGKSWRPASGFFASTDADGSYRLHGLPPGRYRMGASRSNYQYRPSAGAQLHPSLIEIAKGEEYPNVDFVLGSGVGFSVSGQIEGADGENEFAVALTSREHSFLGVAVAKTDQEGAFQLDGIPVGAYHVLVAGPLRGFSFRGAITGPDPLYARTTLDVGGQDVSGIRLTPDQPRAASVGVVVDGEAAGDCPRTVPVHLQGLEEWSVRVDAEAKAAVGGVASVPNLAPSRYFVEAGSLPDGCYQADPVVVDLSDGGAEAVVRLTGAARVEGRLLRADDPSGYRVALIPALAEAKRDVVTAVTPDAEGRFVFGNLRPGAYQLAVERVGSESAGWVGGSALSFPVDAVGGTTTEIELPARPR